MYHGAQLTRIDCCLSALSFIFIRTMCLKSLVQNTFFHKEFYQLKYESSIEFKISAQIRQKHLKMHLGVLLTRMDYSLSAPSFVFIRAT